MGQSCLGQKTNNAGDIGDTVSTQTHVLHINVQQRTCSSLLAILTSVLAFSWHRGLILCWWFDPLSYAASIRSRICPSQIAGRCALQC